MTSCKVVWLIAIVTESECRMPTLSCARRRQRRRQVKGDSAAGLGRCAHRKVLNLARGKQDGGSWCASSYGQSRQMKGIGVTFVDPADTISKRQNRKFWLECRYDLTGYYCPFGSFRISAIRLFAVVPFVRELRANPSKAPCLELSHDPCPRCATGPPRNL